MKLPPRVEPEVGQGFGVYAKYFGMSLAYLVITAVTGKNPESEEEETVESGGAPAGGTIAN